MFDLEHKFFVIYVASLSFVALPSFSLLNIHSFYRPQIVNLIAKKISTKVSNEYVNFVNIFSLDLTSKLLKHIEINDHAIELINGRQPPYGLIYSLKLVELKTLKSYIETNLVNRFIRPSNLYVSAPIFFNQ